MKVELVYTGKELRVFKFSSLKQGDVGVYKGNHYIRVIGARGELGFVCLETCNQFSYSDFAPLTLENVYVEGSEFVFKLTV